MRRLHPEQAPPSLVIVIDEFATLVKQLPDFVADIVDIAQRGRSYGVHLILATQRPSASVDDNILANTNLRISLRMLDRAESMSILNAPDAAEIPVPLKGRSIARLGPGQLVEFQSAYCSAPLANGRRPAARGPGAPRGGRHARRRLRRRAPSLPGDPEPHTQLDALLTAISQLGHPPVRQIWNELLPEHLPFTTADKMRRVPGYERAPGRLVLLGVADDPANQRPARERRRPAERRRAARARHRRVGQDHRAADRGVQRRTRRPAGRRRHRGAVRPRLLLRGAPARSPRCPSACGVGTLDDMEATTRIIETLDAEVARRRAAL